MRAFPVEARSADHRALIWVTPEGAYVYAVVLVADTSKLVAGADLNNPLPSVEDLLADTWELVDWERSIDDLRAIREEGHARRFDADQRRILDRVAI